MPVVADNEIGESAGLLSVGQDRPGILDRGDFGLEQLGLVGVFERFFILGVF